MFVSRTAYDALQARYEARGEQCAMLQRLLEGAERRYDELLLFVLKPPVTPHAPDSPPAVPKEPSRIAKAIREESGGDVRLAAHFTRFARELAEKGNSEDEVIEKIRTWQTEPV